MIESTAEGKEGYFYDLVQKSRLAPPLTPIDFKFFFFPWYKHAEYSVGIRVPITTDLSDYFAKLALDGIHLSDPQKWWYVRKWETQGEDMFREFPSTPDEAFAASQEGYWYASAIKELFDTGHITNIAYDRALPVHTAWDLGQADHMAIWFFQVNRSDDINIIDFWQKTDTRLDQIAIMLKQKNYNYGLHIWPHDAGARDRSGVTFVDQARTLGLTGIVLEPHGFIQGISLVKTLFGKCWFDKTKCLEGIKCLENYKKRWSTSFGGWTSEPVHDDNSHAADAFRYLAAGVKRLMGTPDDPNKTANALRRFFGDGI